jgi:nucleoside-diphosphate-sugar epimerase
MNIMANILVTGGAGYLGCILAPKLMKLGHRVRVLDLFLYGQENLFPEISIKGDIRKKETVLSALQGIDTVIHLAAISNDPSGDLNPKLTESVNIEGSKGVVDCSRKLGVKRFINASSSSVYGIKSEPEVTEELSLEPLTIYSESKVAIEKYLEANKGEMTTVSVRSATICGYSPRMRFDLTVNILTQHALQKGRITVFGGTQKRPNIHIDDISDFYCRLVTAPAAILNGKAYNVCGENHTVAQLAEMVRATVAPHCPVEVVPTNDLRSYHICAKKVEKELGFKPTHTLVQAIRDVADALQTNRFGNPDGDQFYNVRLMKDLIEKNALTLI